MIHPDKRTEPRPTILVADDDWAARSLLEDTLQEAGFDVITAKTGKEAISRITGSTLVVLLDLKMPELDGLQCLEYIRRRHPGIECIMVTASGDVTDAVSAMKMGAFEYLTKPVNPEELLALVERVSASARITAENRELREAIGLPASQPQLVGHSPPTQELLRLIDRVTHLDSTVLITGESGVGKGLVARIIHHQGPRSSAPLVTVSCTALSRDLVEAELFGHEKGAFTGAHSRRMGKVEAAHQGTLFLDEVGDIPLELQPKLLTVLQDRAFQRIGSAKTFPVDVRIIAATHQDLASLCEEKRFRNDLYFRLNVLPIHIPPLRARREDVKPLAEHILEKISSRRGEEPFRLSPDALQALSSYPWPGNVRELENVLERTVAFCDRPDIAPQDLPREILAGASDDSHGLQGLAGVTLEEVERQAIAQTLETVRGQQGGSGAPPGYLREDDLQQTEALRPRIEIELAGGCRGGAGESGLYLPRRIEPSKPRTMRRPMELPMLRTTLLARASAIPCRLLRRRRVRETRPCLRGRTSS